MSDNKPLIGVFFDSPVQGLEYKSQTLSGLTNKRGEFGYCTGETVTFSIGDFVLGSVRGCDFVTPAHLVIEAGGEVKKITNRKVTNLTRFLQSINPNDNVEEQITITETIRKCVSKFRYDINFDQQEDVFETAVQPLFSELKAKLRSGVEARNHLRRTMMGIRKLTDVRVPMRDGAYVLADVYRPVNDRKQPVIMSYGGYGKAFWYGCIADEEGFQKYEAMEDAYFEGCKAETGFIPFHIGLTGQVIPPDSQLPPLDSPINPILPHVSERFERANTADWVPNGYVVIHVDGRGTGKTPGVFEQFSLQEAEDFYDAIEWAAKQPWCNGNVGLYGASYYAMNALNVASLQPPSLKAMIPIAGDIDSYRDYIFGSGGLYNPFNFIAHVHCCDQQYVDWISIAKANPFCDPFLYGPSGSLMSPDLSKINVPFWISMPLESPVHTRGSSEAFIYARSEYKKLTVISEPGIHFWMYAPEYLHDHIAFMDYWLKGINNDIMHRPPVSIMVRTGSGGYYWTNEQEWPLTRTQYIKYYLNTKQPELSINALPAKEEQSISYAADKPDTLSFLTAPMLEDTLLVGHIKLSLWVSSTSCDMAINASIRVIDENGKEVLYGVERSTPTAFAGGHPFPLAKGGLKVSHRKLDLERSTDYRPYHTHLKEDYQPLISGEAVKCEIEILPTTALVNKGWRIRLDIQPGNDEIDSTYQLESLCTIYAGPIHQSYLQLPVIP